MEIEEHPQQLPDISIPILDPFVLSFNNLTYEIKVGSKTRFYRKTRNVSDNTKCLLKDISGEAREGQIMAILGASGSGKSTLIDALANRISKHSLKGSITLNGEELLDSNLFKMISAYVMQDDLLFPMLTVEETLMFAADFRLPHSISKSRKKERVQALIDQLGLRSSSKTVIGDEEHRGVSGGERRRVSIGIDIIHDPILLFLDEPTSGLDSTSALMVVKVLQRIARSGSIVIMSIHQPSSRILSLFDRMIILSHGQTLYNSSPQNLSTFFNDFGHPIPANETPSEFALDFIHELEQTPSGTQSLVEFNKSWQATVIRSLVDYIHTSRNRSPSLEEAMRKSISKGKLVSGAQDLVHSNSYSFPPFANPIWIEVLVLSKRLLLNSRRMPAKLAVRFGTVTITGIILATMFWQIGDSPSGVQERLGCIAIFITTIFFNCITEVPAFIQERFIFMRETAYNAYRRFSYVLARSLIHIPVLFMLSLAFSPITFWAVGFSGGVSGFLFYFITVFASFWAGSSFAAFISGMVPDIFLAFVTGISLVSYFLFLCGFLISPNQMPKFWFALHYISLVKYPYEALLKNEFLDPNKCFVRGVQLFDLSALGTLPTTTKDELLASMNNVLGDNITSSTCFTTGKDVLNEQGITELGKWIYVWIIIAWGIFFRILFYLTLMYGSKNKRK